MTGRLKKIQSMAQRYNQLGAVQDETVAEINAAIEARNIPPVRTMSGI